MSSWFRYGYLRATTTMNIFWLDVNLELSAQYHIDRHITKIPTEVAQVLCDTYHFNQSTFPNWNEFVTYRNEPYRKTNINHTIQKWARLSLLTFNAACDYGLALCKEYTYRYNKEHAAKQVINYCIQNKNSLKFDEIINLPLSEPPQCMPDQYKNSNLITAYRNYYINCKTKDKAGNNMAKWTKREIPSWFIL